MSATDPVVTKVAGELTEAFADTVPAAGVADVVRAARGDLDGQVVPEAMEEMLHRLARSRLQRWAVAGKPGIGR
ncbi:hypothetical protein [Amycolatopsis suaedae]|uniref:Uncharacterized protein n=1 Tax=Amycolatopsis suaedae TaxID=2510978 RepID=A0A4Q7JBU5_9PSEU|nr:hypothetical protein [Amycolatopsis suaedae]RZQ64578.1 hypothetical protein EWH70_06615 [Amycolatopsis suaedae]